MCDLGDPGLFRCNYAALVGPAFELVAFGLLIFYLFEIHFKNSFYFGHCFHIR